MNATRRETLDKAVALLEEATSLIDGAAEEERAAYDNLPEGLQEAERGQRMDEAATELEEASSTIDDVISQVEGAKE